MRSGLFVTVGVGLLAVVLRALAPAPLADLSALAYLIAATSTFGPRLLIPRRARP
jgi:Na+(H+)/acetate symporter ActP